MARHGDPRGPSNAHVRVHVGGALVPRSAKWGRLVRRFWPVFGTLEYAAGTMDAGWPPNQTELRDRLFGYQVLFGIHDAQSGTPDLPSSYPVLSDLYNRRERGAECDHVLLRDDDGNGGLLGNLAREGLDLLRRARLPEPRGSQSRRPWLPGVPSHAAEPGEPGRMPPGVP